MTSTHTPTTRRLIAAARLAADWEDGADTGPLTSDGLVAELRATIVEAERESPTSRLLAAVRLALAWEDGDRLRGPDLVAELRAAIAAVEGEATTAPHPAPAIVEVGTTRLDSGRWVVYRRHAAHGDTMLSGPHESQVDAEAWARCYVEDAGLPASVLRIEGEP